VSPHLVQSFFCIQLSLPHKPYVLRHALWSGQHVLRRGQLNALCLKSTDEPATDEPATDEPATDEPATDEHYYNYFLLFDFFLHYSE
jgi:hypothetical protein